MTKHISLSEDTITAKTKMGKEKSCIYTDQGYLEMSLITLSLENLSSNVDG